MSLEAQFEAQPKAPEDSKIPEEPKDAAPRINLTDREKKDLQEKYAETRKRIKKAEAKLYAAQNKLWEIGDNKIPPKTMKLYYEAEELLNGTAKKFENLESVDSLIVETQKGEKETYENMLRVHNITDTDTGRLFSTLFSFESDANVIIKMVDALHTYGLKKPEISEIFLQIPTTRFIDIVPFFQKMKELGIQSSDACAIWKNFRFNRNTPPKLELIVHTVSWLKSLGITDDLHRYISTIQGKSLSEEQFELSLKDFKEIGLTKDELMKVMTTNCIRTTVLGYVSLRSFLITAKLNGVSVNDAFTLWTMLIETDNAIVILQKLLAAHLVEHIQTAYEMFSDTAGHEGAHYENVEKVIHLAPLRKLGIDTNDIINTAKVEEEDIVKLQQYYAAVRIATGLGLDAIRSLYYYQKDEKIVVNFFEKMKDMPFSNEELKEIFLIENNPENAKKLLQVSQRYMNKGFTRLQAFGMAKATEGYKGSVLWVDTTQSDIDEFIEKLQEEKLSPDKIAILWMLYPDHKYAATSGLRSSTTIAISWPSSAIPFIGRLQKAGISSEDISRWYQETNSPEQALKGIALMKEVPDLKSKMKIGLTVETHSCSTHSPIIEFAEYFYSKTPEEREFIKHLIAHTQETTRENLDQFLEDPTVSLCAEVYAKQGTKDVELALRMGRSLYYQGYKHAPEDAVLEQKRQEFEKSQNDADGIKVFEGRNVVYIANGEKNIDGSLRFNSPETLKKLSESIGNDGTFDHEAPSTDRPSVEELRVLKKRILERMVNTPPPMTMYFHGHGGPNNLFMNNGKIVGNRLEGEDTDTISVDDIADVVHKRSEKYRKEDISKDIYILSSCFNHTFMRQLFQKNTENGSIQPIVMGSSEYGQFGFTHGSNDEKDIENAVLQLGKKGTTIGDIRKNEKNYMSSNYTVYVPNAAGQPQQIVKNENIEKKNMKS